VHIYGHPCEMKELKIIAKQNDIFLIEDCAEALGSKYENEYVGTFGDISTLSFYGNKILTTGEGGMLLTNDETLYDRAYHFKMHGLAKYREYWHDFIGYNYRISELHAAVGLAQFRKLDLFLSIQKKNHQHLQAELAKIPDLKFRTIPDPAGDSHTFLSWFMPTRELTEAVVAELKTQQAFGGNFYWFEHNWHYIRKWDHLKSEKTLNRLTPAQSTALNKLKTQAFSQSDAVMGCCISTAISLSWTAEQLQEKALQLTTAIKKVLAKQTPTTLQKKLDVVNR